MNTIGYTEPGCVLLFRSKGMISALIRWQTRSQYNHAAILLPGETNTILEVVPGRGVRERQLTKADDFDVFDVLGMTLNQWAVAVAFAEAELGEPYDWQSIFRFITRTKASIDERWFCSELVFAALDHAGVKLLERIASWQVAPGHLAWSPKLVPTTS